MIKIGDFSKLAQVSVKALRYYDKLGLLKPTWIDRYNGYRYYALTQLPHINRILALKELGLSLEQIQQLLIEDLSSAELRGMLRMREAEVAQLIEQEQTQLTQIQARLQQLDHEGIVSKYDVVVKAVPEQMMAGFRQVIPDRQAIPSLFQELSSFLGKRVSLGVSRPTAVYYDTEYHEQKIDLDALLPVSALETEGRIQPGVPQVACTIHQGSLGAMQEVHSTLHNWIEVNGFRIIGPNRDMYLQGALPGLEEDAEIDQFIIEVQYPIEKRPPLSVVTGLKETNLMEAKFVTHPKFTMVGVKYHGKNENDEIKAMWQKFLPRMGEIKHSTEQRISYGACWDVDENEEFDYIAGIAVSDTSDIPAGMVSAEIPEQTYAVFQCTLPQLFETFGYIYKTWLPASDYVRGDGPEFEYYDDAFSEGNPVLSLYIPVKPKP